MKTIEAELMKFAPPEAQVTKIRQHIENFFLHNQIAEKLKDCSQKLDWAIQEFHVGIE
jgi:5'-3' exonuclease